MPIQLTPVEARILGCLVEKATLTPEAYPLSFNALLNACNQKTSRDPVMELDFDALGVGMAALKEKGLAGERIGNRVPKFVHHAELLKAGESPEVLGILCVLLLRGAQTAAEIRVRTERMAQFPSNEAVEAQLQKLQDHPGGPFVARLVRGRVQHLFCGAAPSEPAAAPNRLSQLEERVAALERAVRSLQEH